MKFPHSLGNREKLIPAIGCATVRNVLDSFVVYELTPFHLMENGLLMEGLRVNNKWPFATACVI
jgi:hypothetical protein